MEYNASFKKKPNNKRWHEQPDSENKTEPVGRGGSKTLPLWGENKYMYQYIHMHKH